MKTLLKYYNLIAKLLPRHVDVQVFVLDQSWILFIVFAGGVLEKNHGFGKFAVICHMEDLS